MLSPRRAEPPPRAAPAPPALAEDYLLAWIGGRIGRNERRQVVFLGCAFDDPGMGAALDPEDLAEILAGRRDTIAEIVGRHGGFVSSTTLARQIVCWGWPRSREDDTRLAVAAALEIAESLGSQVRCVLDAGIAVVDRDGEHERDGSGLIATAVTNVHSMLTEAPRGAILVRPALRSLLGGQLHLEPERLPSQGRHEPEIRAWRVAGAFAGRANAAWVHPQTLFGRGFERAMLARLWNEVADGGFRRLWIHGEAGIGKTALVADLRSRIEAAGGVYIEAACLPETQGRVLSLARQLDEGLAEHGLCSSEPCLTWEPGVPQGDAVALAGRTAALLRLRREPGPIAIGVEDAHWADPPSLEFLLSLAAALAGTRSLMLVVTSRAAPPQCPASPAGAWQAIEVCRLAEEDLRQMLRVPELTPELPEAIRQVIAQHAEGIPFYARELAWLTARGPDRLTSESQYRLLASPNRLNACLLARPDAVGELKHLAQAAAVLGRVFETRLLAAVLEADETKLRERLDALVNRGIMLAEHDRRGAQYRFSHTLLWSAAYGSLLKSRRRQLHARAAEELTKGLSEIAEATPKCAAAHFTKAGDHANAFGWWDKAAHRADQQGKSALAIAHIDRALSARSAAPQTATALDEARLHSLLGKQLGILQGSASAATQAAYQRALALLSQLPARPGDLGFDIQWGLSTVHLVRCDIDAALEATAGLIEEARAANRNDQLLVALRLHGTAKLLHGCVRDAIDLYRMAEALYDPKAHSLISCRYASDQGIIGRAHLAWAMAIAGDEAGSRAAERAALVMAGRLDHPHTSANALGVLATAAKIRGDAAAAAALAHACLEISRVRGFEYWIARARIVLAWIAARRDPAQGLAMSHAAADRYRKTGSERAAAFAYCIEAEIALLAGEPRRALQAVERAEHMGSISPRFIYASELLRLRAAALVAVDAGQRPAALATLARAQCIAEAQGATAFARRVAETSTAIAARRTAHQRACSAAT